MSISEENRFVFKQRFRDPMELLITQEHTGFALMMIALPLLERYIRGRRNLGDISPLPDAFFEELRYLFPEISDLEGGRTFWQAFRHGIVHQATFSLKGRGKKTFSGYLGFQDLNGQPLVIHKGIQEFYCMVDPIVFARTVLAHIEQDLGAFNLADTKHPIAMVGELPTGAISIQIDLRRRIRPN